MRNRSLVPSLVAASAIALTTYSTALADTTARDAAVSANWAGYTVGASPTTGQANTYSHVSGSWVAPTVDCSTGEGNSSFWVGLGGSTSQSGALEQTGTSADCDAQGDSTSYAWYELVPAAPVRLPVAIRAGNHVSASVNVKGDRVTIMLKNQTSGQTFKKTLTSGAIDTSSAEWVAEAPSQCNGDISDGDCSPVTLADFGTMKFRNASATANGHTGSIADPQWAAQPMELDSADGESPGAAPTTLSTSGKSFSVSVQAADGSGGASGDASGDPSGFAGGGDGSGYGDGGGYGDGSGYGDGGGYGYGGGDGSGYGDGGGYGYGGGDGSGYDGGGYGYSYGGGYVG